MVKLNFFARAIFQSAFVLTGFLLCIGPCTAAALPSVEHQITFMKQTFSVGNQKITVEVAKTNAELEQGLMFRKSLAANDGMIFIFESDQPLNFWMKNTYVPLSVAFFDHSGKLVDIKDMEAVSTMDQGPFPTYASAAPAQIALEMNKGWFKAHGISVNAKSKARLSPVPKVKKPARKS